MHEVVCLCSVWSEPHRRRYKIEITRRSEERNGMADEQGPHRASVVSLVSLIVTWYFYCSLTVVWRVADDNIVRAVGLIGQKVANDDVCFLSESGEKIRSM